MCPAGAATCLQEEKIIKEMFKRHDTDGSQALSPEQLKPFLQEYVQSRPGFASKIVSDAEVK